MEGNYLMLRNLSAVSMKSLYVTSVDNFSDGTISSIIAGGGEFWSQSRHCCTILQLSTYVISDLTALFRCHVIHSVIHRSEVESFYFRAVFFLGGKRETVVTGCVSGETLN